MLKRKTRVFKETRDPLFKERIIYSANAVLGRTVKVVVIVVVVIVVFVVVVVSFGVVSAIFVVVVIQVD